MSEMEIERSTPAFVRRELVPERAAPIKTTGFVGFLRTRLFNSPSTSCSRSAASCCCGSPSFPR